MADRIQAQRLEIARRYKRKRNARPCLTGLRLRDLNRLLDGRYGATVLPDDDAARDDVVVVAHHLGSLAGDPRKRITSWLKLRAPWYSLAATDELLVDVITKPRRWRADKLAWKLRLLERDRAARRITTIGAVDVSKWERAATRKERNRLAKQAKRRAAGVRARADYEAQSINRTRPWQSLGLSRAAWYRRGKPPG